MQDVRICPLEVLLSLPFLHRGWHIACHCACLDSRHQGPDKRALYNPHVEPDLEISPTETAALLKEGNVKLIDVRTPQEYAIAHIEGCPLVDQALAKEIVETWPKDTSIITICHHGVRSLDAAVYLRQQGFTNVRSMRGGIDVWSQTIDRGIPRY